MKQIVIFGAGKSSTFLIEYLITHASSQQWKIIVLDADENAARSKINNDPNAIAAAIRVEEETQRRKWIGDADLVISLLPPALHHLVAIDCLRFSKSLFTASYVDPRMRALQPDIEKNGSLFLCEMGLDPGIDHMSAMKIIHELRMRKASITSFRSHCGGLVAPENDDNPWHYKISWNPRNVVLAGKAGALYREDGKDIKLEYPDLFEQVNTVNIPGIADNTTTLAWYANRDSLSYIDTYALHEIPTFIRTTLRHPSFIRGWHKLASRGATDELDPVNISNLSLKDFFSKFSGPSDDQEFNDQRHAIGANDESKLNLGPPVTAADILQYSLEKNLPLKTGEKDMIVMLHEIGFLDNNKSCELKSSLVVKGDNEIRTAMAKTVGLPLAIAAKLFLQQQFAFTGLHIPVTPEIYNPVLAELEHHGIKFHETISGSSL